MLSGCPHHPQPLIFAPHGPRRLRKALPTLETCDDVARATTRGGAEPSQSSRGTLVQRVIDGDTVVLANGERVRYIGMDTPERGERLFDEATEYNRRLVEGQRVGLLKDQSETDRFGRLLRYVLAGDILVNAELVREGLAEAKRYDPDVKVRRLLRHSNAGSQGNGGASGRSNTTASLSGSRHPGQRKTKAYGF